MGKCGNAFGFGIDFKEDNPLKLDARSRKAWVFLLTRIQRIITALKKILDTTPLAKVDDLKIRNQTILLTRIWGIILIRTSQNELPILKDISEQQLSFWKQYKIEKFFAKHNFYVRRFPYTPPEIFPITAYKLYWIFKYFSAPKERQAKFEKAVRINLSNVDWERLQGFARAIN